MTPTDTTSCTAVLPTLDHQPCGQAATSLEISDGHGLDFAIPLCTEHNHRLQTLLDVGTSSGSSVVVTIKRHYVEQIVSDYIERALDTYTSQSAATQSPTP